MRLLSVLAFLAATRLTAAVLFTDDFNGPVVDTTKWTVATPFSDSFVSQGGGYIQVEDGGRITTGPFAGGIEVSGRLQISNNTRNNSKLVLRTDGQQYFSEVKGVVIQFSPRKDWEGYVDQLSIFTIGESTQTFAKLTTPIALDAWYDFRVIDNGSLISLFWNGSPTATLEYATSYRAGDQISFYSREGGGNNSWISNDGRGRLDYLTVESVPDVGGGQFMIGMAGCLFIHFTTRRRR